MTVLYEFGFHLHLLDLTKILVFILPFSIYLFTSTSANVVVRVVGRFLAAFISVSVFIILFIGPIYAFSKIKGSINEGNFCVVEGEVCNFKTPENAFGGHESESFTINGKNFCYYGTENYGYAKFLCNGGVITGNGQKLRITYCNDPFTGEVVICYIEEAENANV